MINRYFFQSAAGRVVLALFWLMLTLSAHAQTSGQVLSGAQDESMRANQSQVFWHDGYWWGLFRNSSNNHSVRKFDGSWSESYVYTTGVGSDFVDGYIDPVADKLYILLTKNQRFYRLGYSNGTWSTETSVSGLGVNTGEDFTGSIVKANDGDLFIFTSVSNTLKGLHSDDDGENWTTFNIRTSLHDEGMTDGVAFRSSGGDYVGVFLGENNSSPEFYFYKLSDSDDPTTISNWGSPEDLNFSASYDADNHVSMIKDFDQNLYVVGKYGSSKPSGGVVFMLFERENNSTTWNVYDIVPATGGFDTRPALTYDETNDVLYVFATIDNKIQYATLDQGSLGNIGSGDWTVALQNGSDSFNEVTLSYQQLTSSSGLMVAAENTTANTEWYDSLGFSFSQPSSLVINEVNSTANVNAAYVEIYNTSASVVSLSGYELRYYSNNGTSPASESLGSYGNLPGYGYVVLARSESAFNSVYGVNPDFDNVSFSFDGGKDGVSLYNGATTVDYFNNAGGEMLTWNSGQMFTRERLPNDGSNIYFDYDRSRTTVAGTPGDDNDTPLPVLLASFSARFDRRDVHLEWSTSSELDNFAWIILRKGPGERDFSEIVRLPGAGTTNAMQNYDYSDNMVFESQAYEYRLANIDFSGRINYYPNTAFASPTVPQVGAFELFANYPNPFNPETNIRFRMGERAPVQLTVFDINGRTVRRIYSGNLEIGEHTYHWDGQDDLGNGVASGVYLLDMNTPRYRRTIKMMLVR